MPCTTKIRPLRESDIPAALELWHATPGVGLSSADEPDALLRFMRRNPTSSLAAENQGALVGTVLCGHDGRRGLIHHLVVHEDFRRSGLGRSLLTEGLDALRLEGIEKCHLLVFRENTDGLAFWQAVGARTRPELVLLSLGTIDAA